MHACSCCSKCLTLKSQLFSNVVYTLRTKLSSKLNFLLQRSFFVVDTGAGTREINEKDSTVVSFSSTVGNRNRLKVKDDDSFGNTSETYECTAGRSPAHVAVVIILQSQLHSMWSRTSIWGTNQLCSLVNIRGFANENSPGGREVSWGVASTKEVLVRFE